jgi:hypothetical protein
MGTNSTMTAVIGATENLGFIAAMRASGATAKARTARSATWFECGIRKTDGASVDRPAESSDEIVERCLQRSSDAHLRHDYGRHDCPQRQGELYKLRKRKSQHGGNCHPD